MGQIASFWYAGGVPRFEPFAAVHYDPARVEVGDVVAPPYDVVGPEEQARLEARSPYNVVRVDLAPATSESGEDTGQDRYEAARCRFEEWLAEGVLVVDPEPGFYVYRMGWRGDDGQPHQTSGVLGLLELDPAGTGSILPHERTMPKPLGDRLRLMRACRANVSPIWTLSLAPGLSGLCEPSGPPLLRCTDDDGVHHRLWHITAPAALEALATTVASAPVVIADGHHRYETALAYQAEQRAAFGDQPRAADLVLAYVVELAEEQLGVRPIHRLLSDLPDDLDLATALAPFLEIEPVGAPTEALLEQMARAEALALVTADQAHLLHPRPEAVGDAMVDTELLDPALDHLPPHTVGYHHDLSTVLALLDKGEAQAAILVRPVTVDQIATAAAAGRRLPQKTSFFHPKLRTGLAFRLLDR
ncbi:MAG: DUF1015 domain-containing protein [Actinomycetota bacterium]|nr:DUF1015 domain-containing protein [Actinomycetota bacterium]